MLRLTESAENALKRLISKRQAAAPSAPGADSSAPYGLRLAVRRGGCAGMQYSMEVGLSQPGDLTLEQNGARLFVDADSAPFFENCTLDYRYALQDAGFVVLNPQAVRSCGCGTSFEPSPGSPDAASLPLTTEPCASETSAEATQDRVVASPGRR